MSKNNAVNVLRGYFYQFDYSINTILNLKKPDDEIIIEGIEDLDISTASEQTAIQCKYYEKTEYNHSVIAKAIRKMFDHFMCSEYIPGSIKYKLYGHFKKGQEKLPQQLNIEFIKKHYLTYKNEGDQIQVHEELAASDEDIQNFLRNLDINVHAISFAEQNTKTIESLQETFKCTPFEARNYYYNNAIKQLKELSTSQNISSRTINPKDFLKAINQKKILFNLWFIEQKGKKAHYKEIKNEHFSDFHISPYERFFLIDTPDNLSTEVILVEILYLISKNWFKDYKNKNQPHTSPYVYISNLSNKRLKSLKRQLYTEGLKFTDGFNFLGADFDAQSCVKAPSDIKLKILSHKKHIEQALGTANRKKEIYQFYFSEPFYECENLKHLKIQVENLNDIKEII